MKKVIKIKQSDIRGILKTVLNEQGYSFEQSDNPDYAAEENDQESNGEAESTFWSDLRDLVFSMKDNGASEEDVHQLITDVFADNSGQDGNFNQETSDVEEQGFMYENKSPKKVIRVKESELRKLITKTITERK